MQAAERNAADLREIARVAPGEKLDPFFLATECGLQIVRANAIELDQDDRDRLAAISAKEWSGGCFRRPLKDGSLIVVLNPAQTPERERVTVLEEVAHHQLGHATTPLPECPAPGWDRSYDKAMEREAYWVAAATLLPSSSVGRAVWQRSTAESLAQEFGVSKELVEFRIKTLLLWNEYVSYRS